MTVQHCSEVKERSTVWVRAATVGIFVVGTVLTLLLSNAFRQQALTAWEEHVDTSSRWLSGTILNWIEESYVPLSGMANLFENSSAVSESEFLNGYDGLESRSTTFFLDNCLFVRLGPDDRWKIVFSTDLIGDYDAGFNLYDKPTLIQTLDRARSMPNQMIIGRIFIDAETQARFAPVALALSDDADSVVLGLLNVDEILAGVDAQYHTPGLFLSIQAGYGNYQYLNEVIPRVHEDDALHSISTRTRSADADIVLTWDATETFEGGPDYRLAQYSLWAGLAGSLLLTIFIGSLLKRNQQVMHMVREATADLSASEERFRQILGSAGEGIFGVDNEGRCTFANQTALQLLGFTLDELLGQAIHDLIHHTYSDGTHYPAANCPMRAAFASGETHWVSDEMLWRKDGTGFPVEYTAAPMRIDGAVSGAVITFMDISDRREAENALRAQEEKLRTIMDNLPCVVILKDREGRHLMVNSYYEKATGVPPEAIIGKTDAEVLPTDIATAIMTMDRKAMESGESISFEEIVPNPDGTDHSYLTTKVPLADDTGSIYCLVILATDITTRKEMEEELRQAKATTEDALAVITSSIQYASYIQHSVLPPPWRFEELVMESFVLWEPRDVVGGDLYWCELWGEGGLIMLGDCTGHGVPGAFMTLLATGALKRVLTQVPEGDAAGLVSAMHQLIQRQLGQHEPVRGGNTSDDGLELGLCYIPPHGRHIIYSGARMPLFIDNDGEITLVKGDRKGIAYRGIPLDFEYTNTKIEVVDDMTFYMATDGIIDQVGGDKGRGFGKKRFVALLESLRKTPLADQGGKISEALLAYQGDEKRRDDVSIVGFRL
jgi:PAS domain S-box-containing protein